MFTPIKFQQEEKKQIQNMYRYYTHIYNVLFSKNPSLYKKKSAKYVFKNTQFQFADESNIDETMCPEKNMII